MAGAAIRAASTPAAAAPMDFGTTSFTVTCGDASHNFIDGTSSGSVSSSQAAVATRVRTCSAPYDTFTHTPSACVVSGAYTGGLTCTNNPSPVGPRSEERRVGKVSRAQSDFAITQDTGAYMISPKQAIATENNGGGGYKGSVYTGSGRTDGLWHDELHRDLR